MASIFDLMPIVSGEGEFMSAFENTIRKQIKDAIDRKVLPGVKPAMDYIKTILDNAHATNLSYDVSDMLFEITAFADQSIHHGQYCISLLNELRLKSSDKE